MLLSTWNVMSQPMETFWPELAAIAAPIARESIPVTAQRLPMPIFVISAGSGNFFDQSRQNTTAPTRNVQDARESRVISHVVGVLRPKKMRSALCAAQAR